MSKEKDSVKLKNPESVRLTKSILGVPVGSVLVYDKNTNRYVYNEIAEDVAEDSYEYSSNLLDLDPTMVIPYIGEYFEIYEESIPENEEVKPADIEESNEVVKESFIEGDEGDLVVVCGVCGHETHVAHMTKDFIVSLPINNYAGVDLTCEECGAKLSLKYTNISKKEEEVPSEINPEENESENESKS